jgi:RNA polymerase sigma-70 factor (ECF subfamily)
MGHGGDPASSAVIEPLRRLWSRGTVAGLGDAELLGRFAGRGDESAFEALVHRHGPAVLGVCRRVLRDGHDAEDAFQAVFLVLARKAGSIRDAERLGPWLHGVAVRTARKALRSRLRRRDRESWAGVEPPANPGAAPGAPDLGPALDEELAGLPARYRDPLVLCLLEGHSRAEAARRLGLPEGTLSSRLSRGRTLLSRRLARRGLAPSALAAGFGLARIARAAVPPSLARLAIRAARHVAGGATTTTGPLRPEAATLARGVSRSMFATQLTLGFAVLAGLAAVPEPPNNDDPVAAPGPGKPGAGSTPAEPPYVLGRLVVHGQDGSRDVPIRALASHAGLVPGRPITPAALREFRAAPGGIDAGRAARVAALEGRWIAVGETIAGQWLPVFGRGTSLTFEGDRVVIQDADVVAEAWTRLGEGGDPEAIDFAAIGDGPGPRALRYRYRLRGETLSLCMSDPAEERPVEFGSTRANGQTVLAFRRALEEAAAPLVSRPGLPPGIGRLARASEKLRVEVGVRVAPFSRRVDMPGEFRDFDALKVVGVEAGSIAAESGLRVGDLVSLVGYGSIRLHRREDGSPYEARKHYAVVRRPYDLEHALDVARTAGESEVGLIVFRGEAMERYEIVIPPPETARSSSNRGPGSAVGTRFDSRFAPRQ